MIENTYWPNELGYNYTYNSQAYPVTNIHQNRPDLISNYEQSLTSTQNFYNPYSCGYYASENLVKSHLPSGDDYNTNCEYNPYSISSNITNKVSAAKSSKTVKKEKATKTQNPAKKRKLNNNSNKELTGSESVVPSIGQGIEIKTDCQDINASFASSNSSNSSYSEQNCSKCIYFFEIIL